MPNSTRKSKRTSSRQNQLISGIILIGAVIFGSIYLITGSDPFGLFSNDSQSTTEENSGLDGNWWQVYFTDPSIINDPDNLKGSIPEKLIYFIDQSQDSIHIASFEFDLTPVADALINAYRRGVDVRWVTDDEYGLGVDNEPGHGQFKLLRDAGILVKDDNRSALMHNKFWIFDDQLVWTGSTNITQNGNFRNNNNVIVIQSRELALIYEKEFEEMWNEEFGPRSPSTVNDQRVSIDGTSIQVYFASEDNVLERLIPLIARAKDQIIFMSFSFTHNQLGDAILARAKEGVEVEGIFETRGSETEYSRLPGFYCAGLNVRQDGNPGTFHHKVFVIDNQIVITGSLNFSDNANDSNDENVLVINNKDIATLYLQEFQKRWAEAESPEADKMNCK